MLLVYSGGEIAAKWRLITRGGGEELDGPPNSHSADYSQVSTALSVSQPLGHSLDKIHIANSRA